MDKRFRYERQAAFIEGEDKHRQDSIQLEISGRRWQLYRNLNLYLVPTLNCNASCRDCVGKYVFSPQANAITKHDYVKRLDETLDMLALINPSVSIVGGEPAMDSKLPAILRILKEKSVRKPILDTNASCLMEYSLIDIINKSSIEHVNISRRHYNEGTNQRLMRLQSPLTNKELEGVIRSFRPGIKVRLQTCLDKNGIKDLDSCRRYMGWAKSVGASSVAISEQAILPEGGMYSFDVVSYSANSRVTVTSVLDSVEHDPRFSFKRQILGPFYYEEVYVYKGIDVVFKHSDFAHELTGNFLDFAVLHTNGVLTGCWDSQKRVISNG